LCAEHKKRVKNEDGAGFSSSEFSIGATLKQTPEACMDADFILAGFVGIILLIYLVYAMFNAEKF